VDDEMAIEITAHTILPARREPIELKTADGLTLVGELALPEDREPAATLVTFHPLPTAAGMMDSHVLRKAAWRLPALADLAVLRFNTRGTESARGRSEGEFANAVAEQYDVAAAFEFAEGLNPFGLELPNLWALGWSFGSELVLKYGCEPDVRGAILLSPPVHRTRDEELKVWGASGKPVTILVPEFDDYLRPAAARERFLPLIPQADIIGVDGAKHLWVGEKYVRIVLDEIVRRVNPSAAPLPIDWDGPYEKYAAHAA
jgi:uncharacterized protein